MITLVRPVQGGQVVLDAAVARLARVLDARQAVGELDPRVVHGKRQTHLICGGKTSVCDLVSVWCFVKALHYETIAFLWIE